MFSRLRRRLLEVATADDLTPSQTAVLIRLVKDGPASTSQLAGRGTRASAVHGHHARRASTGTGSSPAHRTPRTDAANSSTLTARGPQHAENDRKVREEWLVRAMQDRYTEPERRVINEALTLLERLND